MGRKFPLLLLTLMLAGSNIQSFSASATSLPPENERDSWSVIELLEVADEVNERIRGNCNGDSSCMLSNLEAIESGNDKYAAYLKLRERRFLISSINPSDETFRVIYFDDSIDNKINGIDNSEQINHAIFMWFDEWRYQININFRDDLYNDDLAGKHILFYADERQTHRPIIASGIVTEFQLSDGAISGITNGRLDYSVGAGPHFDRSETADFTSCNAEPGDECRAMISTSEQTTYQPASPKEALPPSAIVEYFAVGEGEDPGTEINDDNSIISSEEQVEPLNPVPNDSEMTEEASDITADATDNITSEDNIANIITQEDGQNDIITSEESTGGTKDAPIIIPTFSSSEISNLASSIPNEPTVNESIMNEPLTPITVTSALTSEKTYALASTTTTNDIPNSTPTETKNLESENKTEVPIVGKTINNTKSSKSFWWIIAIVGICLIPFIWFILPTKKNKKEAKKSKNL